NQVLDGNRGRIGKEKHSRGSGTSENQASILPDRFDGMRTACRLPAEGQGGSGIFNAFIQLRGFGFAIHADRKLKCLFARNACFMTRKPGDFAFDWVSTRFCFGWNRDRNKQDHLTFVHVVQDVTWRDEALWNGPDDLAGS